MACSCSIPDFDNAGYCTRCNDLAICYCGSLSCTGDECALPKIEITKKMRENMSLEKTLQKLAGLNALKDTPDGI